MAFLWLIKWDDAYHWTKSWMILQVHVSFECYYCKLAPAQWIMTTNRYPLVHSDFDYSHWWQTKSRSMYGTSTYIWLELMVNVGKYSRNIEHLGMRIFFGVGDVHPIYILYIYISLYIYIYLYIQSGLKKSTSMQFTMSTAKPTIPYAWFSRAASRPMVCWQKYLGEIDQKSLAFRPLKRSRGTRSNERVSLKLYN